MKRLISFVLMAAMLFTSVASFAAPSATKHEVQNNVYVEGSVGEYVAEEKLLLTLTVGDEVVYVADYADSVKADGSYAIKFKHTGDLTGAEINVKYAGEDVTSSAVKATATTAILEAEVMVTDSSDRAFDKDIDQSIPSHTFEAATNGGLQLNEHTFQTNYVVPEREGLKAVVNLKNKFAYETKFNLMVAAYDKNKKLLDCKIETFDAEYGENGEAVVYDTAVIDVPAETEYAKAFCWSSNGNLIPYGEEADGELDKVTVYCIGDSTGQTWQRKWYPQAGWGTYLQDYLNAEYATVYNNCTSGAWAQSIMNNPADKRHPNNSTEKNFWGQGDWQEIEALWQEGDYVIVCLGINDSGEGDIDGKYTDVEWFTMAYEEMAKQAKAAGVTMIIISATPSASTDGSGGSRADFNAAAKAVADKFGLVYLDHAAKMVEVFNESPDTIAQDYYLHRDTFLKSEAEGGYGLNADEIAKHGNEAIRGTKAEDGKYYYDGKATGGVDTTHTSIKGANLACQKIVECLKDSTSPLRFYVK